MLSVACFIFAKCSLPILLILLANRHFNFSMAKVTQMAEMLLKIRMYVYINICPYIYIYVSIYTNTNLDGKKEHERKKKLYLITDYRK